MSQIITIAQQKGGSGKTTVAAHLAVALANQGSKVSIIDIDPQGSLSTWYSKREQYFGEEHSALHLVATSGWRVSNEIMRLKKLYDFIIIDSPPHIETETKTAIRVADFVLVPVQPTPTDLWATQATVNLAFKEHKLCATLLNRMSANSKLAQKLTPSLPNLLKSSLGNRVAFASCMLDGRSVQETEPYSVASKEIDNLISELLLRMSTQTIRKSS